MRNRKSGRKVKQHRISNLLDVPSPEPRILGRLMNAFAGGPTFFSGGGGTGRTKKTPTIYHILSICPGLNHAWVDSSVGKIRKPLNTLPTMALEDYDRKHGYIRIGAEI